MTREKALDVLTDGLSRLRDKELEEAIKVAIKSIHSMEKMKEDTDRLNRGLSERIRIFRQALRKEIKEQKEVPSWSYVRGLELAYELSDKHLTRIEGLMEGEEYEED